MRKNVLYFILGIVIYFIGTINIYALSLNCSTLLKQGSRGDNVKVLQMILNQRENCNLVEDGIFGNDTKLCVKQYQLHNNLEVDGIVGKATCNSLNGVKNPDTTSSENSTISKAINIYKRTNVVKGVVIADGANIRKAPSTKAKSIGKVLLGKVVTILGQEYDWYIVKSSNNKIGYIRTDLVSKNCIVVDISEQKLIVLSNGIKDWSTNVITGNQGNHDTPVGSYVLRKNNLVEDRVLRGQNDNGTSYASFVDYWMPFITERGIGFHDASWRKAYQYNSSTYQGNGSHGCVNMQRVAAEKLYYSITSDINVVVRN